MRRLSLEELKREYVGKTFNWLTVLDVYRNNHCTLMFTCQCKCGKVFDTRKNYVLTNHTTSCGCYKHSQEKADKFRKWCKENPDKLKEQADNYREWYKNNPDKVSAMKEKRRQTFEENPEIQESIVAKNKQWCKNNPDKLKSRSQRNLKSRLQKRDISYIDAYKDIIHPDDYATLQKTYISKIRIKCPVCGEYEYHPFSNVFTHNHKSLKPGRSVPMCSNCRVQSFASGKEIEIVEFIKTICSDTYIRNSRSIIPPFELDIYYPEKQIAIEFNGDYWHDENHKPRDYHYNKYLLCKQNSIILVSIFESFWDINQDAIKKYLIDLFNGISNSLSYQSNMLNNNFPDINNFNNISGVYVEDSYIHRNCNVFTCGYTNIS